MTELGQRCSKNKQSQMQHFFKYFILFTLLSCGGTKNYSTPNSYKIYCWDFFSCNDTIPPFNLISTQTSVDASVIINDKYQIINDSSAIKSHLLYNLLLNGKNELGEKEIKISTNARFVILINYKERKSDTLIYYSDSSFCLNNKFLIHYNFRVLDSLKSSMNIKCFECKYP